MNWGGNTHRRDLESDLSSINVEELQEWGRNKDRDFLVGYGYLSRDRDQQAELNNKVKSTYTGLSNTYDVSFDDLPLPMPSVKQLNNALELR